jgi:hypothetical protein
LFGLKHELITRDQYATLVTVVILTAIIPTIIAERWFDPGGKPREESWVQPSAAPATTEAAANTRHLPWSTWLDWTRRDHLLDVAEDFD